MEGSGLEDLWATVYACNSLPKMMDGKAYTKTLRACLLTDAALHLTLIQKPSTVPPSQDENNNDVEGLNENIDERTPLVMMNSMMTT